MKPIEIIEIVDRITPNAHSDADKLRWLESLDAQIYMETALMFDATPLDINKLLCERVADAEQKLAVPEPYAEELYCSYLQACMAWADEDDARYDRFITRFNDAYQRFMRFTIRNAKQMLQSWLKF